MNKWRRYHKQYLARRLTRYRAIRQAWRGLLMAQVAARAMTQIATLHATPPERFGGLPAKVLAVAQAVIDGQIAMQRAHGIVMGMGIR